MGWRGVPGASLRAFEAFGNGQIYGADIDKRILFDTGRIRTFFVDQTDTRTFETLRQRIQGCNIRLLIDDGLHCPSANINSLVFGLSLVSDGGWVVIEDIKKKSPEAPNIHKLWRHIGFFLSQYYHCSLVECSSSLVFAVNKKVRKL